MFEAKTNIMETKNISHYRKLFSRQLTALFLRVWQVNFRKGNNLFWYKTLRNQLKARKSRDKMAKQGLEVPPVMIFSITNRCNLNCAGCYAHAQKRNISKELSSGRIRGLFSEASDLGTGIILLAGGEPLMRRDVLEAAAAQDSTLFPVFTNGLLLQNGYMDLFNNNRNLIPVLSLEGDMLKTDNRRGNGVYDKVIDAATEMKKQKMFYGMSITLNRNNFEETMSPDFINNYYELGCRLFFFVEYVPSGNGDINKCLTVEQKSRMSSRLTNLRLVFPSLFIALPGDEEQYGGCLAAGRGFVHVSSTGDLEPCPFAPWSDVNLASKSLVEGLQSDFLRDIRAEHSRLKESEGGCTLWENREWTREILNKSRERSLEPAGGKEESRIIA